MPVIIPPKRSIAMTKFLIESIDNPSSQSNDDILKVLEDICLESNVESQPAGPFLDPEVIHMNFKPPPTFYPVQSKGPYIETFYQAVYKGAYATL